MAVNGVLGGDPLKSPGILPLLAAFNDMRRAAREFTPKMDPDDNVQAGTGSTL